MKRSTTILMLLALALASCKSPDSGTEPEPTPTIPTTPGRHDLSVTAEGVTRWFIYYIPASYSASRAVSLIFAFHGGNGGMQNIWETRNDLITLSDQKGFILVFPNGQNDTDNKGSSTWKGIYCCGYAYLAGKSDAEFVRVMIQKLGEGLNIDTKRIHAMGFSNGGILTHHLAAQMPDVFASVVTFSAAAGGKPPTESAILQTAPTQPIPIMIMHGMDDTRVNYNGGPSSENPDRIDIAFLEKVVIWTTNNHCNPTPATTSFAGAKGKIFVSTFGGGSAEVIGVSIQKVAHGWPDVQFAGFDGTAQAVTFMEAHPKP